MQVQNLPSKALPPVCTATIVEIFWSLSSEHIMVLNHSKNTDVNARGSTFNDVGRDQIHNTTIHHQTINLNISVAGPTPDLHDVIRNLRDNALSP
jgi:hypothetical protein